MCGFFGYILSEKIGLMRAFKFEKVKTLITLIISLVGGILFSLDAWTFAKWIPVLSYENIDLFNPIVWLSAILYDGIIEEIIMRLFFMSLIAFLIAKLLFKKEKFIPTSVLVVVNIIAAFIFAIGHLPATAVVFKVLTPLIISRCFLMNGTFGLIFGYLYRKYGIHYAVMSHIFLHIISKVIWIIML